MKTENMLLWGKTDETIWNPHPPLTKPPFISELFFHAPIPLCANVKNRNLPLPILGSGEETMNMKPYIPL